MNIKEIKEILVLMKENDLCEIEIEKEGIKLKLKKEASGNFVTEPVVHSVRSAVRSAQAAQESLPASAPAPAPAAGGTQIKSPMVGTFYASPAPDQPAYISVGQTVKPGDVLCIIEAMKLMNEIKSDIGGVIEEILVKNGEPLEFDQPLFRVRKTS